MKYNKAIIKLLLNRVRTEFGKGAHVAQGLQVARMMAKNIEMVA